MAVKVSDYIVDFLVSKGITDVFGYPGGMVTHLMESFSQKDGMIKAHVNYHEQAAAFCACGYAQISGSCGVAYATSGPGATNLITGICNAYFDSIATLFITGQVNTFEGKGNQPIRQKGFQETDIISMVKGITKYCSYIDDPLQIKKELEKAWTIANEGRKGPVLLDIPMDVQRAMVDTDKLETCRKEESRKDYISFDSVKELIRKAQRPLLLVGAGGKDETTKKKIREFVHKTGIPLVTSMPALGIYATTKQEYYGFIGAYGDRCANFLTAKSDLIIALGTRLDVRQIGAVKENFAPLAQLIRVDLDEGELSNTIKEGELKFCSSIYDFLEKMDLEDVKIEVSDKWINICDEIKNTLKGKDDRIPNEFIKKISRKIPEESIITVDVGQNQVWIAQSFETKFNQDFLFSCGHGAMGYSLPAAIGAYYAAKGKRKVYSFNGDGGIQMNIQELQFIVREKLPITIVIINNNSLGMIRHFQEMYFKDNYYQTIPSGGYTTPDFQNIAKAYGLGYMKAETLEDVEMIDWSKDMPEIVEILINEKTYVFPKLEFGKPNQDQEPLLDRSIYDRLMEI